MKYTAKMHKEKVMEKEATEKKKQKKKEEGRD